MHGKIYSEEHGFGIGFEAYVMESLVEFYHNYHPEKDKIWVVESEGNLVGFLLLMHRAENQAQLRYFVLEKEFRGLGIGGQLMQEWMAFYKSKGYSKAYLYTTKGLSSAASLYEKAGFKKISEKTSTNFGVELLEIYYELYS